MARRIQFRFGGGLMTMVRGIPAALLLAAFLTFFNAGCSHVARTAAPAAEEDPELVAAAGVEPGIARLSVEYSTVELHRDG